MKIQKRGYNSGAATGKALVLMVLGAMVGLYYLASPYIAIHRAGIAIDEGNSEYLCDHIDFEQVQANLEDRTPPVGQPILSSMLESGLNCDTLDNALSVTQRFGGGPETVTGGEVVGEILDRESTRFESPVTFSVRLSSEEAQREVRAVMTRTPLSWKVTDVRSGQKSLQSTFAG